MASPHAIAERREGGREGKGSKNKKPPPPAIQKVKPQPHSQQWRAPEKRQGKPNAPSLSYSGKKKKQEHRGFPYPHPCAAPWNRFPLQAAVSNSPRFLHHYTQLLSIPQQYHGPLHPPCSVIFRTAKKTCARDEKLLGQKTKHRPQQSDKTEHSGFASKSTLFWLLRRRLRYLAFITKWLFILTQKKRKKLVF